MNKKWNLKLQVPNHPIVNNIVAVVKDTTDYNTYRIVNLSFQTLWKEKFCTEKDAINKIINFKNKFLIDIQEI